MLDASAEKLTRKDKHTYKYILYIPVSDHGQVDLTNKLLGIIRTPISA